MKNLFLIGGGGNCHSCIDVIEKCGNYNIEGIFDLKQNIGRKIFGYEIIGTDENIANYISSENYFLITIGQIKTPEPRIVIYELLKKLNANLAIIISPRAYVSKHALLGRGTIVMHDSLINANATIGENCVINTKSLIEHDSVIANHCHISTGAIVNGNCIIEEKSFIGSNSILREGSLVPKKSVIQAGMYYRDKQKF
ncbi:MAG: NeuD/PglB/VioB family sugar acetyltransferase [Bacteriovoracaceae bacterium]|nr:NeuD/PglB/VioB family sugar acetyltransferase [Bacteriovoracaceae bacterium]